MSCVMMERAPVLTPAGAYVTLTPNALKALKAINPQLLAAVQVRGLQRMKLNTWYGRSRC